MDAHERCALPEGWEWKIHSEYVELFNSLLTNFEINASIPILAENELNDFINICRTFEKKRYVEA